MNKVIRISEATVADMIKILKSLPDECTSWVVSCCGSTEMYVHTNYDCDCITFDTEDLFAYDGDFEDGDYEYEEI